MKKIFFIVFVALVCSINVYAKEVQFNVNKDNYSVLFKVYENDKYLEDYVLNEGRYIFFYDGDKDLKFVHDYEDSNYEKLDDIIVSFDENKKLVDVFLEDRLYDTKIRTYYGYYINEEKLEEGENNLTIYDSNFKEVGKCMGECNIKLKRGDYYLKDNITGDLKKINVYKESDAFILRYYVEGLISNIDIDKIVIDNKEIKYRKENNMYWFNYQVRPSAIDIYVDGKKYSVDLSNYKNQARIKGMGNFYILDKLDDNKEDIVLPNIDNNSNNNSSIDVLVPDTGIDFTCWEIFKYVTKDDYYI